jgi:hypothetical protein
MGRRSSSSGTLVNPYRAMQRLQDQYAHPAAGFAFWTQKTPRTFSDDVLEQTAEPTRPGVTLMQWVPAVAHCGPLPHPVGLGGSGAGSGAGGVVPPRVRREDAGLSLHAERVRR